MSETETLALVRKDISGLPFEMPIHVSAIGQANAILAFQLATALPTETSVSIKAVCTVNADTWLTEIWLTIHDDGVVEYAWSSSEAKGYFGQIRPV